ncbi:glycosyltransferase family A protein [Pedobacter gandavensis]|uniref:glycosyltransferase family 2 protein n=1 Tax=Pedobacter gandavensis TaxID=2679963 RepID=UPI00292D44A7|nr:glycosyltransferase family A protein [Pedobacter gandavensis]
MDEYISVYCINENNSNIKFDEKAGYKIVANVMGAFEWKTIRSVVELAKENNDEVVVILKEADNIGFLPDFDCLYESLVFAVEEGFHFIQLIGSLNFPYVSLNQSIAYVTDIKECSGFLITSALFDLFLEIDTKEIINVKLEVILNHIIFKKSAIMQRCAMEVKERCIHVIVPFRNIERYLHECCQSILTQNYRNFRVYFVDDCSTDGSLGQIPEDERFVVIKNSERKYALENILNVLEQQNIDDSDVVVILDGDDKLTHNYVFQLINEIYSDKGIKLTYGSLRFMNTMDKFGYCYTEEEFKNLRTAGWKASHLKTFKYEIYKAYKSYDPYLTHMKDKDGNVFMMPYDIALMFPLLEVSRFEGTFFVKDPIYMYRIHDDNDQFSNRELQQRGELEIRAKRSLLEV